MPCIRKRRDDNIDFATTFAVTRTVAWSSREDANLLTVRCAGSASAAVSYFIGHCSANIDIIINTQKQQRRHVGTASRVWGAATALFRYELIGPSALCSRAMAECSRHHAQGRVALATRLVRLTDRSVRRTQQTGQDGTAGPRSTTRSNSRPSYTAESAAVVPSAPGRIEWKMRGPIAAGRPPVARWKVRVAPAAAIQNAFN